MATWLALGLTAALLAGCAGLRTVDSDVESHTAWPEKRPPGVYAFERLPSQQAQPQEQARIEAAAAPALARAGFRRTDDAAQADVLVQAASRITRYERAGADLFHPFYGGYHRGYPRSYFRGDLFYGSSGRWGFSPGFVWMMDSTPTFEREVVLLIRNQRDNQVLYETRAQLTGSSSGSDVLMAAMFLAAMRDFPYPAVNPRRARIDLDEVTGTAKPGTANRPIGSSRSPAATAPR